MFLAELERLRQHAGAIQEICESTALVVATSQAGILEEDLLRVSGELTGHRYLFGLLAPGGLLCDLPTEACRRALSRSQDILRRLNELERHAEHLQQLSRPDRAGRRRSRLPTAKAYSLVGPVARASGLRPRFAPRAPYSGYEAFDFDVPSEQEGDGYARLRVLFAEARQSVRIMEQAVAALKEGDICRPVQYDRVPRSGWSRRPAAVTFHWVRLDEGGRIARYRVITPSFTNWHSFHLAAEKFAFQDFPIILSTFDLSVAENDR